MDPLKPTPALLCKLGSVLVHAEEMLGPGGHQFDKAALETAAYDPEVKEWREAMDKMAMLPKKRN